MPLNIAQTAAIPTSSRGVLGDRLAPTFSRSEVESRYATQHEKRFETTSMAQLDVVRRGDAAVIERANDAFIRAFGFERKDLVNGSPADIIHASERTSVAAVLDGMFQDGFTGRFQARIRRWDGFAVPCVISALPIYDKGGIEVNRAVLSFAPVPVHDGAMAEALMSKVLSVSRVLLDGNAIHVRDRTARTEFTAATRRLDLFDGIIEILNTETTFSARVSRIVDLAHIRSRSMAAEHVTWTSDAPETVQATPDVQFMLMLCVYELAHNAFQHAFPNGSGKVNVTCSVVAGGRLSVSVTDNGIGLPGDALLRTCRGLRLTEDIINSVGGLLTVDSVLAGTRVRFSLPA